MAGRIPQQFIDDLLTRVDIVDVIDGYVPLRRAGKNLQARCPFHDEKTPSFTVSQDKQFYHCFGCGANGTAITFLMEYAGKDFVSAVEDLASQVGLEVPREGGSSQDSGNAELYELMELIFRYYRKQLRDHPEGQKAIDYLKGRGISGECAGEYELGYAPPGWDNLINSLGTSNSALLRLGSTGMIINRDNGGYYDRFRDRVIFPIRDQRGRAIGMGGRVLDDSTPKYLNSPETDIFHKGRELYGLYQARQKQKDIDKLFVVEGYMDVLALAQHGVNNVVATLGTAVTPDHVERMFRVCPQIIFCFDGDTAGQKAAWRALDTSLPFIRDGKQVDFLFMPEGDDPDTYIRKHGAEKFTHSTEFVPLSDYLLNQLKQDIDLKSREGRASLVEKASLFVNKLPQGVLKELILKDLASISQLPVDTIREIAKGKKPPDTKQVPRRPEKKSVSSATGLNDISSAIRMLLHHPQVGFDRSIISKLENINNPGIDFLRELLEFISSKEVSRTAVILEHWRDTKYEARLRELAMMEDPLASNEVNQDEIDIHQQFMSYILKIESEHHGQIRKERIKNLQNIDDLREFQRSNKPGTNK